MFGIKLTNYENLAHVTQSVFFLTLSMRNFCIIHQYEQPFA